MPDDQPIHIIGGPTASGKSAFALAMAQEKDGVIINADSMQIYDALPLLSAQPAGTDTTAAPHRLYGALPYTETCSAARWRDLAVQEIEEALAQGHPPILVGGTGFYIDSLLRGLSPMPDVPAEIRNRAMGRQAELGNPGFHADLVGKDPVMASRLHPNDTQRLVRAWEVIEATGRSLADWQEEERVSAPAHWRFHITLVMPERETLYKRCNARFDWMMANGALDEAEAFLKKIGEADYPVTHALGFRPLRDYFAGRLTLPEATERAKAETRQYAKRQVTWFRHQLNDFDPLIISKG